MLDWGHWLSGVSMLDQGQWLSDVSMLDMGQWLSDVSMLFTSCSIDSRNGSDKLALRCVNVRSGVLAQLQLLNDTFLWAQKTHGKHHYVTIKYLFRVYNINNMSIT